MYPVTGNEGEIPTTTAGGDENCVFCQGAGLLRASRTKNYQKCKTVVEFELQEADMCDNFEQLASYELEVWWWWW